MNWDTGKKTHLNLADYAAEAYQIYGTTNSATRSYMEFEETLIRRVSQALTRRSLAIDLGCGEGRIAFVLAELFDTVTGYDMSPEMIRVADLRRLTEFRGNTRFTVRDLEVETLSDILSESADMVVGSFGMASFVERPEIMLAEISRVLRPGGKTILSFYNADSLVHQLPLPENWEASLAAIINDDTPDSLVVTFGDRQFLISARAYSVKHASQMCSGFFTEVEAVTYPAISAILPQSVSNNPQAIDLCQRIDSALSADLSLGLGAYILVTATKPGQHGPLDASSSLSYRRLMRVLDEHQPDITIREHAPVRTIDDVRVHVQANPEQLLKSVMVTVDAAAGRGHLLCLLASNRRVSLEKLAREIGIPIANIRLATPSEAEEATGFPLGALSPIGMPPGIPVIIDMATREHASGKIWCGAGKRTESLNIAIPDLERAVPMSIRDISDPTS